MPQIWKKLGEKGLRKKSGVQDFRCGTSTYCDLAGGAPSEGVSFDT